ncbi:MAG TPA: FAD-dependent oxidoreductase, partial [Afipia sp.]|nr:FAD-dependent oxidoreductase [Afipia sp.]
RAPADRAGRVLVEPDLTAPGHPDIFVIGDAAHVESADGKLVPGVAPAAKQEGQYVARRIMERLRGRNPGERFAYKNAGNLATIGKRAAIVDFGWIKLKGRLAWWMWGVAHIFFLIGLRNRLAVAMNWLWIYISGQRSARLITQGKTTKGGI